MEYAFLIHISILIENARNVELKMDRMTRVTRRNKSSPCQINMFNLDILLRRSTDDGVITVYAEKSFENGWKSLLDFIYCPWFRCQACNCLFTNKVNRRMRPEMRKGSWRIYDGLSYIVSCTHHLQHFSRRRVMSSIALPADTMGLRIACAFGVNYQRTMTQWHTPLKPFILSFPFPLVSSTACHFKRYYVYM